MDSKDKEPAPLNPRAVFSKTGKGVQEASGKTSHLSRADRNVLKEIDGKTSVQDVGAKFEKIAPDKFEKLIQQLDKDGFIREIAHAEAASPAGRPSVLPRAATPPRAAPPPPSGDGDDFDFTAMPPKPAAAAPKAPQVDLAAAARADSERAAKEKEATDFRARQEAEAKAKAEAAARAKAEAEARAKAEAAARAKAEAEAVARAKAEAEARARAEAAARAQSDAAAKAQADAAKAQAEADAKVRAAREAAVRMATETKARVEAEAKAKADELNAKLEQERKAREDAERRAQEAAEVARRELEEKAKRDAEELRQRLEAEMKAKLEEERAKREEEDRKRREEDERRRKEEDERRAKEDAERKARLEAERKAREEEDRKRREEDERRRKEDDERRAKEDAERKARAEADRKAREEEDRKRREDDERRRKEADERRAKEEAERKAREEADRKRRDEEERQRRESEDRKRREDEDRRKLEATAPPPPPAAAAPAAAAKGGDSFGDSLLADLDSFGKREEEEQKAKEEAERKAKEEAARKAKAEAEKKAKEEAEKKRREEEERRRKEEEERRAQEEAEQRAKEEAELKAKEEAERKRKAKEALAAKQAQEKAEAARAAGAAAPEKKPAKSSAPVGDDDIGVTEDDLDMDDVKRDEKKLSAEARKAARERERERAGTATAFIPAQAVKKPVRWGKPVAIGLFVLLIGGLGFLQIMPLNSAEYQKAASDALGMPVTIRSARLSVLTGVEVKLEGVVVGEAAKINVVRGYGSVFGAKKAFSRLELDGAVVQQADLAAAMLGKIASDNFQVERIVAKGMKLEGPLALPPLDAEAKIAGDGAVQSITLSGPDKLSIQLTPGGSDVAFEISAGSITVPFVPALSLADFGMKGTANRQGVTASQFDGRAFDGLIGGSARIRWGGAWSVEGDLRMRGVRVAVFAPTLVSEGKVEGKGTYSMSGPAPAKLFEGARMDGNIKIENGVLGSFDLTRALQTGGAQSGGRTVFSELTAQGTYDKGTVQMRNIQVVAGNMNGGASLDVDPAGALSGRIVADVKTPSQTLRATLNISGKIQEPVIRK
jgi:actin-related protein